MNIECGIIIDIKGDKALVESDPVTFCASCAALESCKMKIKNKPRKIWMKNDIWAQIGDKVRFQTNPKANVILAIIYYFVPVALLLAGALFFANFSDIYSIEADIAAVIGGIAGLVLSFLIIFIFSRLFANNACFFPRIMDKL